MVPDLAAARPGGRRPPSASATMTAVADRTTGPGTPVGDDEEPVQAAVAEDGAGGTGRVIGLTDGVVAIAMTLLALDLRPDLPAGGGSRALAEAFRAQADQYLAFVIAFAITAQYWVVHHRLMESVRRRDDALAWANMLFLFAITLIPLTSYINGNYPSSLAITVFAANLFLASASTTLIFQVAHRHGLAGDRITPERRRHGAWRSVTTLVIPVLVAVLAWVIPHHASYFWFLFFVADVPGTWDERRRQRRAAATTADAPAPR